MGSTMSNTASDSFATLIDITIEGEVEGDNNNGEDDDEPEAPIPSPYVSFLFPDITPWPIPLPTQHPGLRAAAAQGNADTIFKIWDLIMNTKYVEESSASMSPTIFSIITIENHNWDKICSADILGLPTVFLRRVVGCQLIGCKIELTESRAVRTVGGQTLFIDTSKEKITINSVPIKQVISVESCALFVMEKLLFIRTKEFETAAGLKDVSH